MLVSGGDQLPGHDPGLAGLGHVRAQDRPDRPDPDRRVERRQEAVAMAGDAVAVVALRLGPDRERVLARIGGELGVQARAKANAIAKLAPAAQTLERARVMETRRKLWTAG